MFVCERHLRLKSPRTIKPLSFPLIFSRNSRNFGRQMSSYVKRHESSRNGYIRELIFTKTVMLNNFKPLKLSGTISTTDSAVDFKFVFR